MGKGCMVCTLIYDLISKCSDIKYFEVHWEACVTVESWRKITYQTIGNYGLGYDDANKDLSLLSPDKFACYECICKAIFPTIQKVLTL